MHRNFVDVWHGMQVKKKKKKIACKFYDALFDMNLLWRFYMNIVFSTNYFLIVIIATCIWHANMNKYNYIKLLTM